MLPSTPPRKRMRDFWSRLDRLDESIENSTAKRQSPTIQDLVQTTPSKKANKRTRVKEPDVKPQTLDFPPIVSVCIVPLGVEISRQRIITWTRQLENLGAKVAKSYSGKVTHLVVDPTVPHAKLRAWCRVTQLAESQCFVSYYWVLDSLQQQALLDTFAYIVSDDRDAIHTQETAETTQESPRVQREEKQRHNSSDDEAETSANLQQSSPTIRRLDSQRYNDAELVKMRERYPWLQRASRLNKATEETKQSSSSSSSNDWAKDNRHKFACQLTSTELVNHNKELSDVFERLENIYSMLGDHWRAFSFKKVAGLLQYHPTRITDADELKKIHGMGSKMREKVEEILETGQLQRLVEFESRPQVQTMLAFCDIWGVGAATAQQLWNRGYRSIEDLRQRGHADLNVQQRIGLARYEDLKQKIPRSEVEAIEAVVREAANAVMPGVQCITCGSYRRGKLSSGDVDVLIGPPLEIEQCNILSTIISNLEAVGFVTERLTFTDVHVPGEPDTFMGVCKLPGASSLFRRLDIKVYPRSMFAFAVLYFTGSGHFNRSMRLYANKLGYSLSDKSLCKAIRKGKDKIASGAPIHCYTEEQIFDCLGLEYKTPVERNCFDVTLVDDEYKEQTRARSAPPQQQQQKGASP